VEKYNIGDVWWTYFPYSDKDDYKRRPAIVIDDETIAILTMYVTSQNKENNPYSIPIQDWKEAGLPKESWTRIDKIVRLDEQDMDRKIGELSQRDLMKILQLAKEALNNILHEFSLLAIVDSNGRYLQMFDDRWKSWLFPYARSTDNNKTDMDNYASKLLAKEVVTEYVTCSKHCKYSVSDNVYKIYNHKLYKLSLNDIPENMKE
jgi:mRNA-degrading endonuclease toxin of MazEF toxin-antitoxin module